jgi:hypothetical protein
LAEAFRGVFALFHGNCAFFTVLETGTMIMFLVHSIRVSPVHRSRPFCIHFCCAYTNPRCFARESSTQTHLRHKDR